MGGPGCLLTPCGYFGNMWIMEKTLEQKERRRAINKKYWESEKGLAVKAARKTPERRKLTAELRKKYRQTQNGLAARKRTQLVRKTPEGRRLDAERQRKYRQTERGRIKINIRKRKYSQASKEKRAQKNRNLRYAYGITAEQYDALVLEQEGRCVICGKGRSLCVDHDHITNRVRGLLCSCCNSCLSLIDAHSVVLFEYLDPCSWPEIGDCDNEPRLSCKDVRYSMGIHLRRKYNIDLIQYDGLVKQSEGRCRICERATSLVVDHEHEAGRIRGLLCVPCNAKLFIIDTYLPKVLQYRDPTNWPDFS